MSFPDGFFTLWTESMFPRWRENNRIIKGLQKLFTTKPLTFNFSFRIPLTLIKYYFCKCMSHTKMPLIPFALMLHKIQFSLPLCIFIFVTTERNQNKWNIWPFKKTLWLFGENENNFIKKINHNVIRPSLGGKRCLVLMENNFFLFVNKIYKALWLDYKCDIWTPPIETIKFMHRDSDTKWGNFRLIKCYENSTPFALSS